MPSPSPSLPSNAFRPVFSSALPLPPGPSPLRHHPLPPFQHHPPPFHLLPFPSTALQHLLSSDAPQLSGTALLAPGASLPFGTIWPNKTERRASVRSCLADALRLVLFGRTVLKERKALEAEEDGARKLEGRRERADAGEWEGDGREGDGAEKGKGDVVEEEMFREEGRGCGEQKKG